MKNFVLDWTRVNKLRLLFALYFTFSLMQSSAQFISERQIFSSPDSSQQPYNCFGGFFALNAERLVVTDVYHNFDLHGGNQMNEAGTVYSYTLNNDTLWNFTQKILSNDRFNGERYGYTLAMQEDVLAVGAIGSTLDANQTNFLIDAGAVYIYEADLSGIWKWKQKLVPSIRNMDDEFGYSVSLYGDVLAVGSRYHDYDSNNSFLTDAGSVFMFKKDSNGVFSETQHLSASDRHVDMLFGRSVVLLNENELFIGSLEGLNSEGAVYYFVRNSNGIWEEKQKIMASNREIGAHFGDKNGIATYNDLLVIGANQEQLDNQGQSSKWNCGAAYVFKRNVNGLWQQDARITAPFREWDMRFGSSVALNNSVLVVGAPFASTDENNQDSILSAGAAFVYIKNATGDFEFYQKLIKDHRHKNDLFAGSIKINANNMVIGGSFQGVGTYLNDCIFYTLKDTLVGFTEINPKFERLDAVIYPNPSRGNLTINTKGRNLDRMKMYDVNGRLVHEENLIGKENAEVQLPDNILNGLYLVRIESGREAVNKKLLVNGR